MHNRDASSAKVSPPGTFARRPDGSLDWHEYGGDFNLTELLRELEEEMPQAAANLEFERAALLRDQIMEVKNGAGLTKIEPKRKPVKYGRGGGTPRRRSSRV